MPTFIILINLTDQGTQNVKESPQRFEAFKEMAEKKGLKVKDVYYTMGQYDMVVIMEGPEEAAMSSLLKVASLGNVQLQTMRGFSVDEMRGIISTMS